MRVYAGCRALCAWVPHALRVMTWDEQHHTRGYSPLVITTGAFDRYHLFLIYHWHRLLATRKYEGCRTLCKVPCA